MSMTINRRFLDVSMTVQGTANEPPASPEPVNGTQYIIGDTPAGAFANATPGAVARYDGYKQAWVFTKPAAGQMEILNLDTKQIMAWDGTAWTERAELGGGTTVDQTYDATSANAQSGTAVAEAVAGKTGDLSALTTTAQTDLVSAVNELKFDIDGLGEPFRVKQWSDNTLNMEIPTCTEDIENPSIPKILFKITGDEATEYQVVGMIAYEVFDAVSGGNRINCWPVCQFTGGGQTELSVRWMCGGTTRKTAKRISAWVLLKHR